MWLLANNIYAKMWVAFSLLRVTAYHCSLFPPTNDNHDQEWSKFWQANIGVFGKKILMLFFCFSWQTTFWWIALHCDPRRKNPGTVWCNLQVYLQERRWCMNKSCSSVHWLNSIQKKSSSGELRKGSRKIYRGWSASKRILQLLS